MPISVLLFPDGGSLLARSIDLVTHCWYVHVATDLGNGFWLSDNGGRHSLTCAPVRPFAAGVLRADLPLTPGQHATLFLELLAQVGDPYNYLAIADDLLNALLRRSGQQRRAPPPGHAADCSGRLALACFRLGWAPFGEVPAEAVTPADWYAWGRTQGTLQPANDRLLLPAVPVC
jgi:hypothetical protein